MNKTCTCVWKDLPDGGYRQYKSLSRTLFHGAMNQLGGQCSWAGTQKDTGGKWEQIQKVLDRVTDGPGQELKILSLVKGDSKLGFWMRRDISDLPFKEITPLGVWSTVEGKQESIWKATAAVQTRDDAAGDSVMVVRRVRNNWALDLFQNQESAWFVLIRGRKGNKRTHSNK
jgi:hypothetical protein